MKQRVRVQAPIDIDSASPDSIAAAHTFVTALIFERAETLGLTINWDTYRSYVRRSRRQEALIITGWAKVL